MSKQEQIRPQGTFHTLPSELPQAKSPKPQYISAFIPKATIRFQSRADARGQLTSVVLVPTWTTMPIASLLVCSALFIHSWSGIVCMGVSKHVCARCCFCVSRERSWLSSCPGWTWWCVGFVIGGGSVECCACVGVAFYFILFLGMGPVLDMMPNKQHRLILEAWQVKSGEGGSTGKDREHNHTTQSCDTNGKNWIVQAAGQDEQETMLDAPTPCPHM